MKRRDYASVIIERRGKLLVVKVNYNSLLKEEAEQIKFPGGKEELQDSGDPILTARREVWEETGLLLPSPEYIKKIQTVKVTDLHTQRFFFVSFKDCAGELLKDGTQSENSKVSKPFWMKPERLIDLIYPSHRSALEAYLRRKQIYIAPRTLAACS